MITHTNYKLNTHNSLVNAVHEHMVVECRTGWGREKLSLVHNFGGIGKWIQLTMKDGNNL